MGLLDGKKGLIFGIANDRSIALHVAKSFTVEGGVCGYAYMPGDKNLHRVKKALEAEDLSDSWLMACDVCSDDSLDATFSAAKERFDSIDFLVHSVAYAERAHLKVGKFTDTPRDVFAQALDISAYSLLAMANRAKEMMPHGGSIMAMTYYGSQKVIPGYNVMGVAKAALEAITRYLSVELGPRGIRVNTISAGPLRTLSAMAVGGIEEMMEYCANKTPLGRNIEPGEVGKTAVYLASDLSSGVTGENIFVDAGYNIVGV